MRVSQRSLAGLDTSSFAVGLATGLSTGMASRLRGLSAMLPGDTEFFGPGGRWIGNGCFFGPPEDWPAFQRMICKDCYTSCTIPCPEDTCAGAVARGSNRIAELCAPGSPCVPKPADVPLQAIPTLTPQNIIPPLPNITRTLAPQPVSVPSCEPWCVVNAWITENPALAVAIVLGAAALLWPKGSR